MKRTIICIAGFADNATMFDPVIDLNATDGLLIHPVNLPGFGAPTSEETSILAFAKQIRDTAQELGARTILAHSVGSIIAAEAAHLSNGSIECIVSLEGNLTAEDAYFSGTAANYSDAASFRTAFVQRLTKLTTEDPIIKGYESRVAMADTQSMWRLGCDAKRYSDNHHPGERLQSAASVSYILNRSNCAEASLRWLDQSNLDVHELPGASHWPTIDRAEDVLGVLSQVSH